MWQGRTHIDQAFSNVGCRLSRASVGGRTLECSEPRATQQLDQELPTHVCWVLPKLNMRSAWSGVAVANKSAHCAFHVAQQQLQPVGTTCACTLKFTQSVEPNCVQGFSYRRG